MRKQISYLVVALIFLFLLVYVGIISPAIKEDERIVQFVVEDVTNTRSSSLRVYAMQYDGEMVPTSEIPDMLFELRKMAEPTPTPAISLKY